MAAATSSLVPALLCHDLQAALLTDNLTPLELGLIARSLETLKKESSPDEAYYVNEQNLLGITSSGSRSARSSPTTWSYSPFSQMHSDVYGDTEETLPSSISYLRHRTSRAGVERRTRHWTSGALALLGGLLALVLAFYQLSFSSPAIRKVAASAVSLGSSRSDQTNATAAGTGGTGPEPPGSIQGRETSKITGKRQWLFGVFVLAFSLVSAAFMARLETCLYGFRRWLQPATSKHPTVEEELAELYPIKDGPSGAKDDFAGSDPATLTAIRKSLDDFRGLNTRTHQSAFSLFFHLAAQSRRRQIRYAAYRKACDALHAKVEQSVPVPSDEVAEVLRRQQELRRQYDLMVSDVSAVLNEENLPPDLCQQELEFLTRDFRPALLELAKLTLCTLDKDRRFLEAFIELHRTAHNVHDEQKAEVASADGNENPRLQEPPMEQEGSMNPEAGGNRLADELTSEEDKNELAMLESQFWEARRTLSSYRRENFRPKVPDLDRCFLPELPLSLFAY